MKCAQANNQVNFALKIPYLSQSCNHRQPHLIDQALLLQKEMHNTANNLLRVQENQKHANMATKKRMKTLRISRNEKKADLRRLLSNI